jgi:hypothetical protein
MASIPRLAPRVPAPISEGTSINLMFFMPCKGKECENSRTSVRLFCVGESEPAEDDFFYSNFIPMIVNKSLNPSKYVRVFSSVYSPPVLT